MFILQMKPSYQEQGAPPYSVKQFHVPGAGRCSCRDGQDGGSRGSTERAGEAFGRTRTDDVITEDVQDGMKRRAKLITCGVVGSFFMA